MQWWCSISAHLWASQKAGFRHPIVILSPLSLGSTSSEHPRKGTGHVPGHDVPLVYVRSLWTRSARRERFFLGKA